METQEDINDKFCYTEKDAEGCIWEYPDYSICNHCVNSYKKNGEYYCKIYQDDIPVTVLHSPKTCEYK